MSKKYQFPCHSLVLSYQDELFHPFPSGKTQKFYNSTKLAQAFHWHMLPGVGGGGNPFLKAATLKSSEIWNTLWLEFVIHSTDRRNFYQWDGTSSPSPSNCSPSNSLNGPLDRKRTFMIAVIFCRVQFHETVTQRCIFERLKHFNTKKGTVL